MREIYIYIANLLPLAVNTDLKVLSISVIIMLNRMQRINNMLKHVLIYSIVVHTNLLKFMPTLIFQKMKITFKIHVTIHIENFCTYL